MRNKITIVLSLIALLHTAQAQKKTVWSISDGDRLWQSGKVKEAKAAYLDLYRYDSSFCENNYKLAIVYNMLRMRDSAFHFLYRSVDSSFSLRALSEPTLYQLRSDPRWERFETELINLYQQGHEADDPLPNIHYAKKLFRIMAADQLYFFEDAIIRQELGEESFIRNLVWDQKAQLNEQNLKELEQLIGEEGWPKRSEVGTAATAAFLVIQHASTEKQRKYLPLLRKACEEKEASWSEYALMYDRIQIAEGKSQRYGSQVHYLSESKKWVLYPLENRAEVDNYRKEVGLGPLREYVKKWNIEL